MAATRSAADPQHGVDATGIPHLRERGLRHVPSHSRNRSARFLRTRPDARRLARDARRARDAERSRPHGRVDPRHAVLEAGQPHAELPTSAAAAEHARRLPGRAEVVATTVPAPATAERRVELLERQWQARPGVLGWLVTTDHKRIGLLYFWTTLVFFAAGGAEALLMRTQLAQPNENIVSPNTYDELFTMHGLTMIFFFIIPMTTGAFGNYLIPLMIGARDMAFPRMNALSFWVFAASGIFIYTSLFMGIAPNAGWFDYVPLASKQFNPGRNIDFYALGIIFNSISSTLTAGQFIVTIFKSRAPGMSFNRMPLFC